MEVTFEPVPGYRFSLQIIQLCVLIYARTSCGLRTVVEILNIFEEVLEGGCGKAPSYTSVREWVLKLGLSVYEDDTPMSFKHADVIDESIMVNREKLLVVLGVPAQHQGRPIRHEDVVVLDMKVGESFKREDVKSRLEESDKKAGEKAEYAISDGAHNLGGGIKDYGIPHFLDISHTLGNCMKHVYQDDKDFKALTTTLGKIRLKYHLTDKAWLLPPNMRTIARFMNLSDWVKWADSLLGCIDSLEDKYQEAYSFIKDYRPLVEELVVDVEAIRHLEDICKNQGYNKRTSALCRDYVIRNVVGAANNRRASLGLKLLDYFKRLDEVATESKVTANISSDIIESIFGIYKSKQSPNKLYGITSLALLLPLYPKIAVYSAHKKQDFKERLASVKHADLELWAKENLSENMVALRSKTLKNAG